MIRTAKDQRGLPTIPDIYEIVRRQDGSFDVFHNGDLTDTSIPEPWLESQLVRYGICGEEYRDARGRLDVSGRVRLVYRTGRVKLKTEGRKGFISEDGRAI
jgi:hypothetical protein